MKRSRTTVVTAASCLLLAGAAGSRVSAQTPANPNPSAVQPGAYKVEPSHTRVLFTVSHMGFTKWYGDFTGASGALTLDPKNPAAATLQVSLPIASVSTTNAKLDGELKAADWLDAGHFPLATFKSTVVTPKGTGMADVTGDMTLHGVTKPVTLHVTFNGAGVNPLDKAYTAGFEAHGTIKRSDFGVTKYVPLIGDTVELTLSGAFEKPTS